MYPATPTYWLEATDTVAVGLRRYATNDDHQGWDCADGYHSALVFTGEAQAAWSEGDHGCRTLAARPEVPHDDPAWPVACRCGYVFTPDDPWQDWQELIYQRADTGERVTIREQRADTVGALPSAPPGAMWDAWWMPWGRGPDGIHLMVRCPNGHDWHVDGRASNCTMPDDDTHRCWVRHGDPRSGPVTVDKNGATCSAGGGSILADDYHGFLTNGQLTAG